MTTYNFAPDNTRMRAASIVPYGSGGLLLPLWPKNPEVWQYSSAGVLTSVSVSGLPTLNGFVDADIDGASGAWLVQYSGSLVAYTSTGAVSGYALPANNIYTGLAYSSTFGQPYVVSASGLIFAGSGAVAVSGSGFGRPIWGLSTSGSTLFGLAGSQGVGTFALSGATSGASGFLAFPAALTSGLCLAASTAASAVAIGGWSYAALASGYTSMVFNPVAPTAAGLSSGGFIDLYVGMNDVWTLTQSLSGVGSPAFGAWSPNGLQLLTSDPTNGTVKIYNFAFLSLALSQTLNVPNASAISITTDNLRALVCRPPAIGLVPLFLEGGTWVSGSPQFAAGVFSSIICTGSGQAYGGSFNTGFSFLTEFSYSVITASWNVLNAIGIAFTPNTLLSVSGNILATGSHRTSGYFSVFSSSLASLSSFSWTGSSSGMVYVEGQTIVNDPSNQRFICVGNLFNAYQEVFVISQPQSLNGIVVSSNTPYSNGGTIFGMTSGSTSPLYQMRAPYNIEPVRSGVVSIYTSGAWASATLGSGHVPTAVVFDTSGNVWAATLQNDLYHIGTSGAIISSQTIPQYSGQTQTTPLGISAMTFLGSGLYAASSLAGPLVRLF
jgi:hypothetical protein